ncbi:MAG: RNB domain-containing ribonuclease [Gammaproteobacteria bacterium]|nr:RNB domain-containing ribonuclease [Gammaproteobacteria bacterium]
MQELAGYQSVLIGRVVQKQQRMVVQDLFSDQEYSINDSPSKYPFPLNTIVEASLNLEQIVVHGHVLAYPNTAEALIYGIAEQFQLNPMFPGDVDSELTSIINNPGFDDSSLKDFTGYTFYSIDGADTRDLDQAVYIEQTEYGHCIYYALADASYYVRPGSQLFEHALQRGASYYLPGLMIPMLPRILCEDLISLNEGELRRAMVIVMELDQSGHCVKSTVHRAKIINHAKLSFQQVQQYLDHPLNTSVKSHVINDHVRLLESLQQFKIVGERRLHLAEQHNIVRYRRMENTIKLGQQGMIFSILTDLRNQVESYNEQLSLLCNTEAAKLLNEESSNSHQVQAIYRIHPEPPEQNIAAFENTLKTLVDLHQLDPEIWLWERSGAISLSEYLRLLPETGPYERISKVIHRQAVLTNVRSVFSDQPDQHYGVGSDVYARFSAPMREIVGIFLHKELFEKMQIIDQYNHHEEDAELRDKIIDIANRSREIQKQITRKANRLVLDQLFQSDLQSRPQQIISRTGTVMGMTQSRLYVVLDEPVVEVKVYIAYLKQYLKTELSIDEESVRLFNVDDTICLARVGDPIEIYAEAWNSEKQHWILLIR